MREELAPLAIAAAIAVVGLSTVYAWTSLGKSQTCIPWKQEPCAGGLVQYCYEDGRRYTVCVDPKERWPQAPWGDRRYRGSDPR